MFGIAHIKYPAAQFSLFRIYLGLYLLIVFGSSFGFSTDIWSSEGLFESAQDNLTYGVFPNILNIYDSPLQVKAFLALFLFFSFLFLIGFKRNIVSVFLWYGLACFLNRNNLILNPSMLYIGWLLLGCSLISSGEPWSLSRRNRDWQMPPYILAGCWLLFSLGYFFSGIDKLHSASWINGTAVAKIMVSPLGRPWNPVLLSLLPEYTPVALNWIVICFELLCLPLSLLTKTRKYAWMLVTIVQAGILFFLQIGTIFWGMMAVHIFLFDASWLPEIRLKKRA